MEILAKEIKKGDAFKYIVGWDILGNTQYGDLVTASDDAIIVGSSVIVPFGGDEGRCFMSSLDTIVEKTDATE